MMNQVQAAQNPQLMLNQMLSGNPNLSKAVELVKQSGGNGQLAFMNYAKQLGVDPQQIIKELQSM